MVPLATPCLSFSMSHLFLSLIIASATTRTSYSHVMRNNNKTAQLRHLLLVRSNSTGRQLQVLHFDRSAVGVILYSATPYEQH
ncbi:hypothetical protein V8C43DRAFT_277490 [Trichoderma afarasin]